MAYLFCVDLRLGALAGATVGGAIGIIAGSTTSNDFAGIESFADVFGGLIIGALGGLLFAALHNLASWISTRREARR
jgi:hypothetical protein